MAMSFAAADKACKAGCHPGLVAHQQQWFPRAPQLRSLVLPQLTACRCCLRRLYVSGAILGYKR